MVALMEYVAKRVALDRSEAGFAHTLEWLQANSVDSDLALSFLGSVGIADDWDVITKANPYELFGSTETRLAWMPIEEQDLNDLLNYLEEALEKRGCQHDLAMASEWLRSKGYDEQIAGMALLSQGGGCDCEVVLNVEAEAVYPHGKDRHSPRMQAGAATPSEGEGRETE